MQSANLEMLKQMSLEDMSSAPTRNRVSEFESSSRLGECAHVVHDAKPNLNQPELKFLTITGPPSQRSKEARLAVRSHAMQAFLREKKLAESQIAKKGPDTPVKNLNDAVGRFKLSTWSRKSSQRTSVKADSKVKSEQFRRETLAAPFKLPRTLASKSTSSPQSELGKLDPFGIIPIALTPTTQKLLLHYTTAFTMNSVAVNPEGCWLSFAMTDGALLHATLSLVAYHYAITHGQEESLPSLVQKGEAIRRTNLRIASGSHLFSDTTIATVSLFVNIETMNGARPISDVHMTALEKLVAERGGVDAFYKNRVLQRVITWADMLYSSTWNCTPRFALPESLKHGDSSIDLERFSPICYPELYDYDSDDWCQSKPFMRDVLEALRRISKAVSATRLSTAERFAVSNKICVLEHSVLSLQNAAEFFEPSYNSETDLSESFRIASILYIHIILRELPRTAKMHSRLVSNLKFALEEQAFELVYITSRKKLELLLWIFFVGAAASADMGERKYFITLLVQVCSGLGLRGKTVLKETLEGVVWLNSVCDAYLAALWKEIAVVWDAIALI